ncbi:MAG TPA: hypothetical protein PLJ77_10370, partial [Dokdonella sp.]|uniref:hypothetical protein n=1 Tax=Dokdonella sp. TaxID=2291710 RepID=UPI002B5CC332|nr:hypothetical protein [Dokdonella sp.]
QAATRRLAASGARSLENREPVMGEPRKVESLDVTGTRRIEATANQGTSDSSKEKQELEHAPEAGYYTYVRVCMS